MKRLNTTIAVLIVILTLLPIDGLAWNIPGHMLSGAIAYQIATGKSSYNRERPLNPGKQSLVRDEVEITIGETAGSPT
jgi:hypothetical protein